MSASSKVSETSLIVRKIINASPDTVFLYFTDPALLAKWHAPNMETPPDISVDLKTGGHYRFQMRDMEGNTHVAIGVYKEIVLGKKLVFTWRWEQGEHPETTVTVVFKDLGDKTEVELTHKDFVDENVKAHHNQGWLGLLGNLETLLR